MASTVTFGGAGTLTAGYPVDENRPSRNRTVVKLTPANSELVTIDHGNDSELIRAVHIYKANGNAVSITDVTAQSNTGTLVDLVDANTTTVTFGSGAAAAGPYTVVIEY